METSNLLRVIQILFQISGTVPAQFLNRIYYRGVRELTAMMLSLVRWWMVDGGWWMVDGAQG
ncbi:MAG: hypothetical protein ACI91F_002940, partial [Candidatus Binatia bacterium]